MSAEVTFQGSEHVPKRRKLRNGARSCSECKRRKVRCTFESSENGMCSNCRRRNAACVSADFQEETVEARHEQISNRLGRVEELVHHLLRRFESGPGLPEPETSPAYRQSPSAEASRQRLAGYASNLEHKQLTQGLLAALPPSNDIEEICKVISGKKFYFHLICNQSFASLEQNGFTPLDLPLSATEFLDDSCHPTLLARNMILVALILQGQEPREFGALIISHTITMNQLIEAASALLSRNDELNDTMESLECFLYESIYHKSSGNFKRAWFVIRRAMLVAQTMGIHQSGSQQRAVKSITPNYNPDSSFIWFRIIYSDRFLSLLLGLPQGSSDDSIASAAMLAADTPMGRLDRQQAMVASRLIEKNVQGTLDDDFPFAKEMDASLLSVAKSMPARFWLPPNFSDIKEGSVNEFWEAARMSSQMFYYHLVIRIHLPYLLKFESDEKYDYSKISCVNASREILNRYMAYRRVNTTTSCYRVIDFMALMAGTILLLVHFDSQLHRKVNNTFAHQRLGDRAMLEHTIEIIGTLLKLNTVAVNEKASKGIQCLLQVEAKASESYEYHVVASPRALHIADSVEHEMEDEAFKMLQISFPYFGRIQIIRKEINHEYSNHCSPLSRPLGMTSDDGPARRRHGTWSPGGSFQQQEPESIVAHSDEWTLDKGDAVFFSIP